MKTYIISKLEKLFIHLDNLNYKIISKLAIMNNSDKLHPKHYILNYHKFFTSYIKPNSSVLDVGCGNGALTSDIANIPSNVTGIDLNPNNIKEARLKYNRGNPLYIVGDITKHFQFINHKFDYIVLSNILEHIEHRITFLKEMKEIGQIILIRVPMINRDWLTIYKKDIGMEYRLDKEHYIEYTLETFEDELKKAGLKIKEYKIEFGEILAVIHK